jgi:hypothetical protein
VLLLVQLSGLVGRQHPSGLPIGLQGCEQTSGRVPIVMKELGIPFLSVSVGALLPFNLTPSVLESCANKPSSCGSPTGIPQALKLQPLEL